MSSLLKNLLLALGVSILALLGYMYFLKDDGDTVSVEEVASTQEAALKAQEFIARLEELDAMGLESNLSILTDPRFISLVNYRNDLDNEPFGRVNPFAPVR